MPQIISIQSAVAYGFVGNSAVAFALRRAGHEVWPILTVNFSNHTEHSTRHGFVISADQIADIVQGVKERGAFPTSDAVLSGYQGSAEIGQVILDTVDAVQAENPNAIYCCDPVMGDEHVGFYTPVEVREFIRDHAVPRAEIITPNAFELAYLAGVDALTNQEEVLQAAETVAQQGPRIVVTTSVQAENEMCLIARDETAAWRVVTPEIARSFTGSGDLTSAMFCAHYLETRDVKSALEKTVSVVYSVLKRTADLGRRELALVQAQDQLVAPQFAFTAERID